jgi:CcmD family protein
MTLKRRLVSLATVAFAMLAGPAIVLAQVFEKVEGAQREEIPAVPFIGLAYGFIWIAILAYVFVVARGVAKVNAEIAELRRKVGGQGDGPGLGSR